MYDDPLRAQSASLAAGAVLAAVAVAVVFVIAKVAPRGVPDSAPIVIAQDSGALYVRVGDTLHPVPNLASARLIARNASNPIRAPDGAIAGTKRGPTMGIPGAPATIGVPVRNPSWTVCDHDRTVVTIGDTALDRPGDGRPVLVTPRGESAATTYLLYDGKRAAVDLRNPAVVRALRLEGAVPMAVSRTLLDVLPEVAAISPPRIAGFGEPGPAVLGGAAVGSIVEVRRVDGRDSYVVLRDGVQLVGEVLADLIRFTYDSGSRPVPAVAPAKVAASATSNAIPAKALPQHASRPIGAADHATVCVHWRMVGATSEITVSVGDPTIGNAPNGQDLAQADGDGPNVDAVDISGGAAAYVGSVSIAGGRTGPRFLISDAGVAFGVHDDDAATFLGLGQPPDPAPWAILAHLPHGPELSTEAASVLRDGLPAPP